MLLEAKTQFEVEVRIMLGWASHLAFYPCNSSAVCGCWQQVETFRINQIELASRLRKLSKESQFGHLLQRLVFVVWGLLPPHLCH